jgi:predicted Zn-dependent peptidase
VIRQEDIEYEEDPEDSSSDLLDRALWGDDPMGMPVIGTVANIEGFTRQDLVHHVQSHYVAQKTVVAAAGNFDVESWVALAGELFAGMRAPTGLPASPQPEAAKYVGHALSRRFTQVSQVFVNIGYPLVPPPRQQGGQQRWRLAASLAAHLFGEGMSSPLVDTVREQLGLAYTAYATMESGDVWANFIVHAVTTPDKLDALVTATGRLLRAQAARIDPVDLERAKNQLTVSRVRTGERTYATMEQAIDELFANGTVTPMAEAVAIIDAIEAEEVRAIFERMLDNPPAFAMTGKGVSAKTAKQLAACLVG